MTGLRFPTTIFALISLFECKETSESTPCPEGFSPYSDGACYKVGTTLREWTQGRLYCRHFNAEIVKIGSSTIDEHVHCLAKKAGVSSVGYWIGLNDIRREGEFCWLDDSPKDYHEFEFNQPNGGKGQACILRADQYNGWHDGECSRKLAIVCQYNPGGVHGQSELRAVHSSLSLPDFLFGHVVSRLTSKSVIHCAALCLREITCDMYAYLEDRTRAPNCVLMIMGHERNKEQYDFNTKVYIRLKAHPSQRGADDNRDRPCRRLSLA